MQVENNYCVAELASLDWPSTFRVPSKRFRLFVASDSTLIATETMAQFAHSALRAGMVYFSVWGPDCERFHDAVDDVIVADQIGGRLFIGPNEADTIMTTWHESETLDEACDFFVNVALPTAGFEADSYYWVALCLNNPEWSATIRRQLEQTELPG
jgi:hypothetical protein